MPWGDCCCKLALYKYNWTEKNRKLFSQIANVLTVLEQKSSKLSKICTAQQLHPSTAGRTIKDAGGEALFTAKRFKWIFFLQEKTEHEKKYWAQNKNKRTNKPKDDFLTTSNRNLTEIIFSKRPKLNLVTVVKLKFKPSAVSRFR